MSENIFARPNFRNCFDEHLRVAHFYHLLFLRVLIVLITFFLVIFAMSSATSLQMPEVIHKGGQSLSSYDERDITGGKRSSSSQMMNVDEGDVDNVITGGIVADDKKVCQDDEENDLHSVSSGDDEDYSLDSATDAKSDGEDGDPWQRLPSPEKVRVFERLVQMTMSCRHLSALTIALVKKQKVLMAKNLGHANPEKQIPVSTNTRFAIGSLTKAFTATVVTEILTRNNISLDSPISQLLHSDFRLMDEQRTRSVTIRDLLSHRTGVPGYFHALLVGLPAQVTREQLLGRLRYLPAVVPFRSQFLYNNYLYTLAANVAEHLSGRSWEALVEEIILGPLNMTSTGFVDQVASFKDFALPCVTVNGAIKNLSPDLLLSVSPCGPAGSLYSTAPDMARWIQLLLRNGRDPDGKLILQENVTKETTRAVMPPPGFGIDLTRPVFPISDVELSYGMGWVTSNYRGYSKIWHSGGIVTFSSRLWLLPGVDAGLFVATNGPQTSQKAQALTVITSMAADLLLGESPWLNSSTICTFPFPWTKNSHSSRTSQKRDNCSMQNESKMVIKTEVTSPSTNDLEGIYYHKAFGEITVETVESEQKSNCNTADGELAATMMLKFGRFGQLKLTLVKQEEPLVWHGRFQGPLWYLTASDDSHEPVVVRFLQNQGGRVDRLTYPIDPQYDVIEFRKRVSGVAQPSTAAASRLRSRWLDVLKLIALVFYRTAGCSRDLK